MSPWALLPRRATRMYCCWGRTGNWCAPGPPGSGGSRTWWWPATAARCWRCVPRRKAAPSDAPTAFRCGEKVAKVGLTLGQQDYPWTLFFYGDHSNHCGTVLRPYSGGAVGVWRDNVCWLSADPSAPEAQVHVPLPEHAVTVALATAPSGEVLLGCASQLAKTGKVQPNLFLLAPGEKAPRWSRAAKPRTAASAEACARRLRHAAGQRRRAA